jgi:hypothetical protein
MARNDNALKRLRAGSAIENNGLVLRDINLLRHQYIDLKSVRRVRSTEIGEQEFLDAVNYLSLEGYISLRDKSSKAETKLSDAEDYADLEAMVTSKGIRLLGGIIRDEMVDV